MASSRPGSSRGWKQDSSEIQSQTKTTAPSSRVSSANITKEKQPSVPTKATSNIEVFACFWLDKDVHITKDNKETQKELRKIINHLQTFENPDECEQAIRATTQEKIIFICSSSLAGEIVPRLHDLTQFNACYIFSQDQEVNKEWIISYAKVCDNKLTDYS